MDLEGWIQRLVETPIKKNDHKSGAAFPAELYDVDLEPVALIKALLQETGPETEHRWFDHLKHFPAGRAIESTNPEIQLEVALAGLAINESHNAYLDAQGIRSSEMRAWHESTSVESMLNNLLRRKLPWTEDTLTTAWHTMQEPTGTPLRHLLTTTTKWIKKNKNFPQRIRGKMGELCGNLKNWNQWELSSEDRQLSKRFDDALALTSDGGLAEKTLALVPHDAWTSAFVEADPSPQKTWNDLLLIWNGFRGSKPTKKNLTQSATLIQDIGEESYVTVAKTVLEAVGKPFNETVEHRNPGMGHVHEPTLLHEPTVDLLRGIVWSCSRVPLDELRSPLGDAADRCYQKVRGVGPRNVKIGNACVWVLANHGGMDGIAEINRLLGRVKHASVRKQIERALNAAAEQHGLSREDLDDLGVPQCGLTDVGVRRESFGEYEAELSVVSGTKTQTVWHTPAGKTQKTTPKAVKDGFPDQLKALKADDKKLKNALQGQRDRLERVFLHPRTWSYGNWQERLLDHPLMGWLTRRLIWSFGAEGEVVAGAWRDGQLVDADDNPIAPWLNREDIEVGLWHPIDAASDAVAAWRDWLIRHEVTQPIKQAHREVYVLTDAERETNAYSNRFAAHIIRQHQFHALGQARGWSYQLQGNWDGSNTPYKIIPDWDLRVEYWVDPPGEVDTSDAGIWLLLATDQVRFYECNPDEPAYAQRVDTTTESIALDQVPPRVFSEVMRDVDLFVGVASVGNDPAWEDGGPDGRYSDYWYRYSFGGLNSTAATRKEILERLVPRLKIADRCSFSDKFLVVTGDVRTYKIHLGSGNILMEPNDQYLCIVPGRGAVTGPAGKVFLPFEGDRTLSIILSKAFLLADDTKITDRTILSQIRR